METHDPSPAVPMKLYPQLQLECPEEIAALDSVPSLPIVPTSKRPNPVPRKSLLNAANARPNNAAPVKPVPRPRTTCSSKPKAVDNQLYFTFSIQEELDSDGKIQPVFKLDELAPSPRGSVGDGSPKLSPNQEESRVPDSAPSPTPDIVNEFDPFAPLRDEGPTLSLETRHSGLTNSVFCLDKMDGFPSIAEECENEIMDVTSLLGDVKHKLDASNATTEEECMDSQLCNNSFFSDKTVLVVDKCQLPSSETKFNETLPSTSASLNSWQGLQVPLPFVTHKEESDEDELSSSRSSPGLDPPLFPPPPLPHGYSGSSLNLDMMEAHSQIVVEYVDEDGVILSMDEAQPVPPPRQASSMGTSSLKPSPSPPVLPELEDVPPSLPPKASRCHSPDVVNLKAAHKQVDSPGKKCSSTNSSPIMRPKEFSDSSVGDKIPPPPVKLQDFNELVSSPEGSGKLGRPSPPPPRIKKNNEPEEVAPPLPPKSSRVAPTRTRSWNIADFVRHSTALLKGSRNSKNNLLDEVNNAENANSYSPSPSSRQSLANRALQSFPHSGFLLKTGSNRKDFRQRWCVLEGGTLKYYLDDKTDNPQGTISQQDILSVAKVYEVKSNTADLSCFEVNTLHEKGRSYLFGTLNPVEREGWMEHIVLTIAPPVCKHDGQDFDKAGHIYVRVGMTGKWRKEWLLLRGKTLSVTNEDGVEKLDLRKLMCIQMHPADRQQSCLLAQEEGSSYHLDFPGKALFMQADLRKETDNWYMLLRKAMLQLGEAIEEQQLTQDNVPVIVDKCITFISVHGCTSEGIYRLNGVNSKVTKLLAALKLDGWAVNLKPDDYTVHDVASALKRFLRTLSDPLLTKNLYDQWFQCSTIEDRPEQLAAYANLLEQLPEVNYHTLKAIISHLRCISDNSDRNRMNTRNLAAIFGPTLLTTEGDKRIPNLLNANAEMDVIADLIVEYPFLFKVSEEEMKKDLVIQKALLDIKEAKRAKRPAGDILIGVHIYSKTHGQCINVRISPTMTVQDLCLHAMQNARIRERLDHITVFEVVCNGELERPLHFSEVVLAVTLHWAKWADDEAKDNYLVIKKNELYHTVLPLARQPISMFGELKYAGCKTKHFRKFMIEFKNARLSFYKDAKLTQPEGTWNIEDITWYIGFESKRPAPTRWAITFIEKNSEVRRTRESPYFGRTVCCHNEDDYHKWIAAMLIGEYPNGLLPKREVTDLLS